MNYPEQDIQSKEKSIDKNKERDLDKASMNLVMKHLNSFISKNIDALLSDYTNESVLITQSGTYSNLDEIRAFFVDFSLHFAEQTSDFVLDKVVAYNDLVYITWHAETPTLQIPLGSDTFIIKAGKIYQQTFVGQLNFINQNMK
jgi:hypothetical protein